MKHTNQLNLFAKEINQEDYEEDFKICYLCKESLPLSFFRFTGADKKWRRRECNSCMNEYTKELQKLKITYNLPDNHICPICLVGEVNEIGKKTKWNLDHNHNTNVFRDYLCETCNRGLGMFKDNIQILKNALKYLLKHDETER